MTTANPTWTDEQFAQAAAAEIATAECPEDADRRLELVALYGLAGNAAAAHAELTRLWGQFPKRHRVQAAMLDMLREQRSIPRLLKMVAAAAASTAKTPALRLSLARSLTVLGQYDQAAEEYGELINATHDHGDIARDVAQFICAHPDAPSLVSALTGLRGRSRPGELLALMRYSAFRAAVETDRPAAREELAEIPIGKIADAEIVFDVAVQSFRVGQWQSAVRAARRVLALREGDESALRLLVSACSFAGRLGVAGRRLAALPGAAAAAALPVDAALLSTLARLGQVGPAGGEPRCAVLLPGGKRAQSWFVFPYELHTYSERVGEQLDEHPEALTASVVGPGWRDTGPWEVLAEADLIRPHVMVQRTDGGAILHAFVGVADSESWPWREVALRPVDAPGAHGRELRWIAPNEELPQRHAGGAASIWQQAEEELRSVRIPEQGRSDEWKAGEI